MALLNQNIDAKVGLPPGSLVHSGSRQGAPAQIWITQYNEKEVREVDNANVQTLANFPLSADKVTWVTVVGVHNADVVREVGRTYKIDELVLEDVMHTSQRPKYEDHGAYVFTVLKRLFLPDERAEKLKAEQVSMVLAPNLFLLFLESDTNTLGPVRERIRNAAGRIRSEKADYLLYAAVDCVVDGYFRVNDTLDQAVDQLEAALVDEPTNDLLHALHRRRRQATLVRKSVRPVRDVVADLARNETGLIGDAMIPYLRDLYDHAIRVIEGTETLRDMLANLLELYMTSVSNRMNNVMKVLTVIATTFIPLSFIAGLYGMNFDRKHSLNMPELGWSLGYPFALAVMAAVAIGMLIYFRRKKWL